MIDFSGKKGVILGVGNQRSIAWSVAQTLHQLGAEIALTYLPESKGRFEANVRELGEKINARIICSCDMAQDADIQQLNDTLKETWGSLDFIVHSLAFADSNDLGKPFSQTSRQGFLKAMEISAFSLLPLASGLAPLMRETGGSIVTMSYIGAKLAVPHYNVMGPAKAALESSVRYLARELGPDQIRVNAISAGAIKTLSASGIKNFGEMLKVAGEHSALNRTTRQQEVANTTAFLCSDLATAITGQVIYVDCGYSIMAN
ncbi:MAG: SDR family oxidoreductase [SAR324 cluster bacterium]|nr:SDR family oxidoreductase [SAR324 cluster bacterium]MBF0351236.1 SDR family oxidoreductase [SAR324 cluster bacterium]